MENMLKEFLIECYENLHQIESKLVALEKDPGNFDSITTIFRFVHSIKGAASFLGFTRLESVTHVGENLLALIRDRQIGINQDIINVLLAMADAVREMLASIEATGGEGDTDYSSLIVTLTRLQQGSVSIPIESAAAHAAAPPVTPYTAPPLEPKAEKAASALKEEKTQKEKSAKATEPIKATESVTAEKTQKEKVVAKEPQTVETHGAPVSREMPAAIASPVKPPVSSPALRTAEKTLKEEFAEIRAQGSILDASIRVNVGVLDKLMDLAGELVLTRNQIVQYANTLRDPGFLSTTQRLNLITTELQEGVMKSRMQPIRNVWEKFPRVIRDLAVALGKKVRIELEGEDTEVDKTIIEAITDPLNHLVRNAITHGIENPEIRIARGKPAEGRILLRAFHEGGQVTIEIRDDGFGVDVGQIKQKALQHGLITLEQAGKLTEKELINIIFLPGFSSAEEVTTTAGRGVGLDVVKSNIEKIGGLVDLHTVVNQGTTFKIKIPLTLAIIPALLVTSVKETFAIPQVSLQEVVRIEGERAVNAIESIDGAKVYRLRGNLLPIVFLNKVLKMGEKVPSEKIKAEDLAYNIIVLQADNRPFGLVVDAIRDTEEIVVKPIGKLLKGLNVFAGVTITGGGRVALILDVIGLAQYAQVVSKMREEGLIEKMAKGGKEEEAIKEERYTLLIFRTPDDGRMAIPLGMVTRLEEFPTSKVEVMGNINVVQYRDQIMPLVYISDVLPERRKEPRSPGPEGKGKRIELTKERMQVVVYTKGSKSIGIVVNDILDIVEDTLTIKQPSSRHGVLFSAIINNRVTELLDIDSIISAAGGPAMFDEVMVKGALRGAVV